MAKWYERANEVAFKAVTGGFVFQCPNPWVLARPRYYLVNEAQKTKILGILTRWRIGNLAMIGCLTLAGIAVVLLMQILPLSYGFPLIYVWAALMIPLCLAPHLYLVRKLAPIVAVLPLTDERITLAEQLSGTATKVAKIILYVGLACGLVMVIGGILDVVDAIDKGRSVLSIGLKIFTTIFGGLLSAWFITLLVAKRRLARKSA